MKETYPDVTIREITVSDATEYKRLRLEGLTLYPEAFAETAEDFGTKSHEEIINQIAGLHSSGGFLVGAFDSDNRLHGIVGLHTYSLPRLQHRGHIWGVYVEREYQNRGIGKRIFHAIIERSKSIPELIQLDIEAVTTNKRSHELYKKVGFKEYGIQRRALKVNGAYLDEYILALDLYPEDTRQ